MVCVLNLRYLPFYSGDSGLFSLHLTLGNPVNVFMAGQALVKLPMVHFTVEKQCGKMHDGMPEVLCF
jgi:hypothetical protein